jgi:hypothetical protein
LALSEIALFVVAGMKPMPFSRFCEYGEFCKSICLWVML